MLYVKNLRNQSPLVETKVSQGDKSCLLPIVKETRLTHARATDAGPIPEGGDGTVIAHLGMRQL